MSTRVQRYEEESSELVTPDAEAAAEDVEDVVAEDGDGERDGSTELAAIPFVGADGYDAYYEGGVATPGVKPVPPLHGASLVPLFRNPAAPWRSAVLTEYFLEKVAAGVPPWQAVRTERWKYIHYTELEGMDELYDLGKDPFEMHNVIREQARAVPALRRELDGLVSPERAAEHDAILGVGDRLVDAVLSGADARRRLPDAVLVGEHVRHLDRAGQSRQPLDRHVRLGLQLR